MIDDTDEQQPTEGPPLADTERWGETEFVPGPHVGLVGRLTVALIESGHSSERGRLWSLVAADASIDDVLDELSSTGLKALPSFGIAQVDGDDLRLVARGRTRVILTLNDGSQQVVDASDVRTWREDVVADVSKLVLSIEGDGPATDVSDRFFVLAGSVPAASLERRFDRAHPLAPVAGAWVPSVAPPLPADLPEVLPEPAAAEADSEAGASSGTAPDAGWTDEPAQIEAEPSEAELPPSVAEVSFPPEDSNETISSIDFSDPVTATTTAPRTETDVLTGESSDSGDDNYDFIYGHTVARSVEGAAVRGDEEVESGGLISAVPGEVAAGSTDVPVVQALAGDHDGMTISRADLAAMTSRASGAASVPLVGQNEVLAVLCASGHPNPPHGATCRICGAGIGTSTPVSVPRPPLGVLVFSNGERVVVDRTVLIGRNPRVSGTLTGELPRIVKLESAGQGLSRTHAEVRVEGWQLLLEDLQSTNGTEVTLPGQAPRRLHAGDPVALVPGATVDFGEELQCRVEVVS